jgi:hypothetical protein
MPNRILAQFRQWLVDDGCWYLGSATAHAVALFVIGLIAVAIPASLGDFQEAPAAFDAPDMGRDVEPATVEPFEVDKTPIDATNLRLDAASIQQWKAQPIGGEAEYNDDSPDFEKRGGGTMSADQDVPKLGGLGGFMGPDSEGPAGRGGVGVGEGFGHNPGAGGDGTGFGTRGKGHRPAGATGPSERAVAAALNWIYRHQTSSGKWSLDFRHQCKGTRCSGPGDPRVASDSAATAMALLPFLAAGQTHKSKGAYKAGIAKGITWLKGQQHADGNLAGNTPKPMYAHALATMALSEAYGMTKDDGVGKSARRAVEYIERAQNQSTGGWRYTPGEKGDTSVFGWQIMALKSAQLAGLPVNSAVFDNAQKWLHAVAKGDHLGLYAYQPYGEGDNEVTPTRTAIGLLCRQYLGANARDPSIMESKRCLLENLPDGNVERNCYYWYYATLAMHNFLDSDWDTWNRKMRTVLIETQDRQGCAAGSWDPEKPTFDVWGVVGGRLMTTSFNALTLEVYYRYSALFRAGSAAPDRVNMGFPKPAQADPEQ